METITNVEKLAIIVPYRDREQHLNAFLSTFPLVCNWKNHHIFIIEQFDDKPFARGTLCNIGFKESEDYEFHCFHDVDMIPVISDYSPPESPTHLAMLVTQFPNNNPGTYYYGGVNLFLKDDYKKINGFSNDYSGWGCEDDDLRRRVLDSNFPFIKRQGFYLSLPHPTNKNNHSNYQSNLQKLQSSYDFLKEGLNTLKYELVSSELINNFTTHIKVKL